MVKSSNDVAEAWVCNPPGRGLFGPQAASGVLSMQPAWPATPSLLANQTARVATRETCSEGPVMIDTVLRVATPEGVELSLRLAGPIPRALAWLVDLLWRFAAFIALVMLVVPLGRFGGGLALLFAFALEWLVPAWCEVYL